MALLESPGVLSDGNRGRFDFAPGDVCPDAVSRLSVCGRCLNRQYGNKKGIEVLHSDPRFGGRFFQPQTTSMVPGRNCNRIGRCGWATVVWAGSCVVRRRPVSSHCGRTDDEWGTSGSD